MRALAGIRVLFVSDEHDRENLGVWLRSEGAELQACKIAEATAAIERTRTQVVLLDQRQHDAEANAWIDALRSDEAQRELAVLTLCSRKELASERSNGTVVMPAHPSEVVAALARLAQPGIDAGRITLTREQMIDSIVEARALISDMRGVLQLLNSTGPFRYTALLRFEPDETLTSIWTFDREQPELNAFPEHTPTSASYCSRVRDSGAPFVMPDAEHEPSVAEHPARHNVLSYCGVPVVREDGTFYGTLCQFDVAPRYFQPVTVKRLQDAAAVLRKHWPELRPR